MNVSDFEFTILLLAEDRQLPQFILDDSIAPRVVFKRMIEEGFLTGAVADPVGEMQLAEVEITSAGRLRLGEMRAERAQRTVSSRAYRAASSFWKWLIGAAAIVSAIIAFLTWLGPRTPKRAPIDDVKGFNSINLGDTLENLSGRFKSQGESTLKYEQTHDENKFRDVAELQPAERVWGGIPVSKVRVWFQYNVASKIELTFSQNKDQWLVLQEAFKQKYGAPTTSSKSEELDSDTWVGRDTEVDFFWYKAPPIIAGNAKAAFTSLAVERTAKMERKKREDAAAKLRTEKAKEISGKL